MAKQFSEVWRIWYWVFQGEDWLKVFAAFVTAVTFLSLPKLFKANPNPAEVVANWEQLTGRVQIAEALNIAGYFLVIAHESSARGSPRVH
jgi:hypothetical protein